MAATTLQQLVVRLEADTAMLSRELARADRQIASFGTSTGRTMQGFDLSMKRAGTAVAGFARGMAASLAGAVAVRELVRLSDEYTKLSNRLNVVTGSADAAAAAQRRLFQIAQSTRTELAGNVELYARLALANDDLGASQEQLYAFTQGIGQALAIEGRGAAEASGAILQLTQAIGAGTVRAEEFNSILEGAPRIAQAVAAGLDAAGGSVSKLRGLVIDGKVSSQDFFAAFLSQLPVLQAEFDKTQITVGQALTKIRNELLRVVGEGDKAAQSTQQLVAVLDEVRAIIASPDFATGVGVLGTMFATILKGAAESAKELGALKTAIDNLDFGAIGKFLYSRTGPGYLEGLTSTPVPSVTIPMPTAPGEGSAGAPPPVASSGGGGPAKEQVKLDKYLAGLKNAAALERMSADERARATALLEAESKLLDSKGQKIRDLTAAEREQILAAVDAARIAKEVAPVDPGKAAAESARQSRQEFQSAVDDAKRLTESLEKPMETFARQTEDLDALQQQGLITAETYARAQARLRDELAQTDPVTRTLMDGFDRLGAGIVQSMTQAGSAMEGFRNVASQVANSILETFMQLAIINPIKNAIFGTSASTLGSLFGGGGTAAAGGSPFGPGGNPNIAFGGPRASGGDVMAGRAYMVGEQGPELVVPRSPGTVLPAGETRRAMSGGGGMNFTFAPVIHATAQNARAEARAAMSEAFPRFVEAAKQATREARLRDPGFFGAVSQS
jgi:tape measure domain-containing protein